VPVRLYSIPLSPPSYTARLALERKGVIYKNVDLLGGFQSGGLNLLSLPNSFWSVGPDVTLPLLSALGTVGAKLVAAKCVATQSGETGSATLTDAKLGSLGTLAVNPAPNSTVDIKLPVIGNVARLTLNEQIHNPDGSLTVNAVHLHLLGGHGVGALGDGDVIISSATCGPAGLPMPVASGAGLWIGLGLLGAIAVPVGIAARRRRTSPATAA